MKKLLREPLLHFFAIGGLLFAAYAFLNREAAPAAQEIVVTPGQIEHLLITFSRTWQRPPTREEAQGLIDQFVREEILSREAVKLGLDRNDTVIRRRLQQKMEFVSDDLAAVEEPTDSVLAQYLAEHPDDFRQPARLTFRQVFLSADKRGEEVEGDAAQVLAELNSGADASELGDATLLPASVGSEPLRRIEDTFGRDFAAALAEAQTGTWIGPVRSPFGLHLVRVERREEGGVPALAEVRDAVQREWENARRNEMRRRFYDDLRNQYRVTVEWPETEAAQRTAAR